MTRGELGMLGLSPAQDRVAGVIRVLADEVADEGNGRILFLSTESGCGTSHLLSAVASELWNLDFRVGTGRPSWDSADAQGDSDLAARTQALMSSALSVASTFDPTLSLVASVAGFSAAATQVLGIQKNDDEPSELLTLVLRAAALETPDRPLICLIDDATWLNGAWWTELQFSFAREIIERLPLLLVVAVNSSLGRNVTSGELQSTRVEQSLVERDLAESITLEALTSEELGEWLDLRPREATKGVLELTRGRTGEVAELFQGWLAQGAAEYEKGGLLLEDPDVLVDGAATDLASRVSRLRGEQAGLETDLLREALAFGALEGRSFTAAAVALALERDEDLVEDIFDELVAETPEAGVLLPPTLVEVQDPIRSETRDLWRFAFANRALWKAAQHRLSDVPIGVAAGQMHEAVLEVFGGEMPANLLCLARLADLSGAPRRASHYRSLVTSPNAAALRSRADLVMAANRGDWTPGDYRDAAYVLAEVAMERSQAGLEFLDYTQVGVRCAESAGSIGRHAHATALASEAHVLRVAKQYPEAEAKLREAREIVSEGAPDLLAQILRALTEVIRDMEGPVAERKALLDQALRLFQSSRNLHGEATIFWNLAGIAARNDRDFARARELNEKALVGMRACFSEEDEMLMSGQRANIELADGNPDAAREFFEREMRYKAATGDERGRAGDLTFLARIELASKNYAAAWEIGQSAQLLRRERGIPLEEARTFHVLGDAAVALGNRDQGRELLEEALAILIRSNEARQLEEVEEKLRDLTPN